MLNLFAMPRPEIKLSTSASLALFELKFSFLAAKYGIWLWPHSPATPLGPLTICWSITRPPPAPEPKIIP